MVVHSPNAYAKASPRTCGASHVIREYIQLGLLWYQPANIVNGIECALITSTAYVYMKISNYHYVSTAAVVPKDLIPA